MKFRKAASASLLLAVTLCAIFLVTQRGGDQGAQSVEESSDRVVSRPLPAEALLGTDSKPIEFSQPQADPPPGDTSEATPEVTTLDGRVIDPQGAAVGGALIKLTRLSAGPAGATTRSDDSGQFQASRLTQGTWRVTASAQGYRLSVTEVTVPSLSELVIELQRDAGFVVQVVDAAELPVTGATVALQTRSYLQNARRSGVTNADGEITLGGFATDADDWRGELRVTHADFLPVRRLCTASDLDAATVTVQVERGVSLRGRVLTAAGDAAPGVEVVASIDEGADTQRLYTTADGLFHFRRLPTGSCRLSVASARYGCAVVDAVDLRRGGDHRDDGHSAGSPSAPESRTDVEIHLEAGTGIIAGAIKRTSGAPATLCRVRIVPRKPSPDQRRSMAALALEVATDADGLFRFEGLAAAEYNVEVGGARYVRLPRQVVRADSSDLLFHIDEPGTISGQLLLPGVEGKTLSLVVERQLDDTAPTGSGYRRTVQLSANRPRFKLARLPSGVYDITLLADGREVAKKLDVHVGPGATTTTVVERH